MTDCERVEHEREYGDDSESLADSMPSLETVTNSDIGCVDQGCASAGACGKNCDKQEADKRGEDTEHEQASLSGRLRELNDAYDARAERAERLLRWSYSSDGLSDILAGQRARWATVTQATDAKFRLSNRHAMWQPRSVRFYEMGDPANRSLPMGERFANVLPTLPTCAACPNLSYDLACDWKWERQGERAWSTGAHEQMAKAKL